jgi:NTP pyrophosphatase (non-canonical NTP hydrolase)
MNKFEELLIITMEEASEVAVECSKVMRFANREDKQPMLERELGDLMCMVELMSEQGMIDMSEIKNASLAKREKLKKWSNLDV